MAIAAATPRVVYEGDDSSTAFAVRDEHSAAIAYASNSHIHVALVVVATREVTPIVEGVDYTLTGTKSSNGLYENGIVTIPLALPGGVMLVIWRESSRDQAVTFGANSNFSGATTTLMADRDRLIDQELDDRIARALATDVAGLAYDAGSKAIKNIGDPTDRGDAISKGWLADNFGTSAPESAAAAEAAATDAEAALSDFQARYLGARSANPTHDGNGNPVVEGALYWNTVAKNMRAYDGAAWSVAYNPSTIGVSSFNGRMGAVVPDAGDYAVADIDGLETALGLKANTAGLGAAALEATTLGRQTIYMPAAGMDARTDTSGGGPAYGQISTSNRLASWGMDAATQEYLQFWVRMPKGCNESTPLKYAIEWSHPSTTTNFGVAFQLEAMAISDGESLSLNFGSSAQTVTDTGGTADRLYLTGEPATGITPAGTWAEGDLLVFQLSRLPANGADTLAVDARIHGISIYYTTAASTDS